MTLQSEERPDEIAVIGKLRLDRAEEYDQYQIAQRSARPQYREFSVPVGGSRAGARVCLGYRRCCEFDEGDQPGQDYAVVRVGGAYVVGVVADGVSRSFYGNLAAEYVSNWLVDELWRRRADAPEAELMESLLKEAEARFADSLKGHRIPTTLPAYLIQALQRKKPVGSQAVFAAFVLNVAEARLILYQVGDIRALVHNSEPEPEAVDAPAKGRWSSAGASPLLLKTSVFGNVNGLVIKSDGASQEWGRSFDGDELTADRFGLMAKACAPLDDVSFIAVRLDAAPAAAASEKPAASPPQLERASAAVGVRAELTATQGQTTKQKQTATPKRAKKRKPSAKQRPQVASGKGGNAAAMTGGVLDKTPTHGKWREQEDRKEGGYPRETREAPGQKKAVSPEADDLRNMATFTAGVIVGLVAGTAITLLTVFAAGRLTNRPVDGKPVAQNPPNAQTTPGGQNPPAPVDTISFEANEVEQTTFLSKHKPSLPGPIADNPTTFPGEIIAHVSAEDVNAERVVLVLNEKRSAEATRVREEGGGRSFFVRLTGLNGFSPVTIRVLDANGAQLYEAQQKMRGRESKGPSNKDPFLGYYEIAIKRGG